MAVSKKGSRKIIVDGTLYLYWLKGNVQFRGNAFGDFRLLVQAETGGPRLYVHFADDRYPEGEADADIEARSKNALTPKDVEQIIRLGLVAGTEFSISGMSERTFGIERHYKVTAVELMQAPEFIGKFPVKERP